MIAIMLAQKSIQALTHRPNERRKKKNEILPERKTGKSITGGNDYGFDLLIFTRKNLEFKTWKKTRSLKKKRNSSETKNWEKHNWRLLGFASFDFFIKDKNQVQNTDKKRREFEGKFLGVKLLFLMSKSRN